MSDEVREFSRPLFDAKMWMKLTGVMAIVEAVFIIVATLGVGLIVAWLPIWMGVLMYQSATAAERAHANGDREAMLRSQSKLKTLFIIAGVLVLISIVLTVIGFFFGGIALIGGMGGVN